MNMLAIASFGAMTIDVRQMVALIAVVVTGLLLTFFGVMLFISIRNTRKFETDSLPSLEEIDGIEHDDDFYDDDSSESEVSAFALNIIDDEESGDESAADLLREARMAQQEAELAATAPKRKKLFGRNKG